MDINNLSNSHCITLAVYICFLLYARCNFDKKSFGQGFNHTNFNQEGRRTDQANETPRGKQRGIKILTAQGKSRSKLRGTNPERD